MKNLLFTPTLTMTSFSPSCFLRTKGVGKDTNWTNWFATEMDQGLCGLEDDFVNLASSYLGKIDILKKLSKTLVRKEFWSSLDQTNRLSLPPLFF